MFVIYVHLFIKQCIKVIFIGVLDLLKIYNIYYPVNRDISSLFKNDIYVVVFKTLLVCYVNFLVK